MPSSSFKVTTFPFNRLPKVEASQSDFLKKVRVLYDLTRQHQNLLKKLEESLHELVPIKFEVELTHLEALTSEEIQKTLSDDLIMALVRLEPHSKRGFFIFDKSLAKLLADAALSDGRVNWQQVTQDQIKPITPLGEAVVVYVLISLCEKFSKDLTQRNFKLSFDRLVRETKNFLGLYSHKDQFALFSVTAKANDHHFFLRFGLPISFFEEVGFLQKTQDFLTRRYDNFINFKLPFSLEAAEATLTESDLKNLEVDDIILFDQANIQFTEKGIAGSAWLKPEGVDTELGYDVDFVAADGQTYAKIRGSL